MKQEHSRRSEIPKRMPREQQEAFYRQALRYRFIYSMTGLALGFVSMVGGIALFLNGVTGSTSWAAKILGTESRLTDAAPGAVLFLVGLFVVVVTRYKIRLDRDREGVRFVGWNEYL